MVLVLFRLMTARINNLNNFYILTVFVIASIHSLSNRKYNKLN